jgi:hypothetical protein
MTRRLISRGAIALLVSLFLVGCGGAQQQYYRLTAEPVAASHGASSLSLGVAQVSLPSYIDRSELVFQSGPNEFQVPPNVSWAGSLSDNIVAVLARDLQQLLGVREVLTAPWPAGRSPQRSVALDIRQFHGISGEGAILDVTWQIRDADGLTISHGSGTFHEPINGDGYAAVVAAESRLLAQCAAAIAPSLR